MTVYCVAATGVATGFGMLLLLSVVAGDQVYCIAPVADKLLLSLLQSISFDLEAFTVGRGITSTLVVKVCDELQTDSLIVTV